MAVLNEWLQENFTLPCRVLQQSLPYSHRSLLEPCDEIFLYDMTKLI